MKLAPLVLAALALVATSCRSRPRTWSCNNPRTSACSEWAGEPTPVGRQGCAGMGGVVALTSCPETSVVGICTPPKGDASGGSRMVFYSPRTASDGERACRAVGGAWSAR